MPLTESARAVPLYIGVECTCAVCDVVGGARAVVAAAISRVCGRELEGGDSPSSPLHMD